MIELGRFRVEDLIEISRSLEGLCEGATSKREGAGRLCRALANAFTLGSRPIVDRIRLTVTTPAGALPASLRAALGGIDDGRSIVMPLASHPSSEPGVDDVRAIDPGAGSDRGPLADLTAVGFDVAVLAAGGAGHATWRAPDARILPGEQDEGSRLLLGGSMPGGSVFLVSVELNEAVPAAIEPLVRPLGVSLTLAMLPLAGLPLTEDAPVPEPVPPGDIQALRLRALELLIETREKAVIDSAVRLERAVAERDLLLDIIDTIGALSDDDDPLEVAIERISRATGWPFGQAWVQDAEGVTEELAAGAWHSSDPALAAFRDASVTIRFRIDEGLIGRVWRSRSSEWVPDISLDPEFVRSDAAKASGLHACFVAPVLAGTDVVAVLEFYEPEVRPEDPALRAVLSAVMSDLGTVVRRRLAESELKRYAAELERSNEELERFASVASHDLQEPLRMVSSFVQLLDRRYGSQLDDEAREFIGYAVSGTERMHNLINDLLALSRIGSRGAPFEESDLDASLDAALHNLTVAIKDSGAVVTREPLPRLVADGSQVTQVLQNLVLNGILYAGEGPPVINVSAERKGKAWVITVRDEGIGIDPVHHERVFGIFKRLAGNDETEGTGIGLALCKRIVERHGGTIWIDSAEGQGTAVSFTLPDRPERQGRQE